MFSFKRSLTALVGSLVLGGTIAALIPLVSSGQDKQLKRDSRRSFYLTQTEHTGSQALTACAEDYHMASLWEILDPSNLRYNTELGYTRADSGSGPQSHMDSLAQAGTPSAVAPLARLIVTHERAIRS